MISRHTLVNLVAVAIASGVLVLYAFTQLLAGAIFEDTYPISVRLPESGGLFPGQEVTLSGRVVGTVDDVDLDGAHVVAELGINDGERIPTDVDVTVLRRSPVGEQAINFRPAGEGDGPFLAAGDELQALDATTPVAVQRLLTLADQVFAPVDVDNAATLVAELADTVRGRSSDIRGLITDSARFSEAIAANDENIDRFFREGRTVNRVLAENRETLSRNIGEMADAAAVLADMRTEFEGLLAEAPPVLTQVGGLFERSQANVSCLITDFADINQFFAQPDVMFDGEEALRLNQYFFQGFATITNEDPEGRPWQRIHVLPPQEEQPRSFLPDKRRVPDVLPGGACSSPFGPGAPAAHQADHVLRTEGTGVNRVIEPADNRAQPVRRGDGPSLREAAAARDTRPRAEPAPATRREGLPRTGGAGLGLVLGIGLLAVAARILRRPDGS